MTLTASQLDFVKANPSAAMITTSTDGISHAVRVGVVVVDDRLWSSGTSDRVRTSHLRQDPRSTLFVFDGSYGYLTLETTVDILEGPDVPAQSVRLFRAMQNKPEGPLSWFGGELAEEDFRDRMVEESRVIYDFTVSRAYGLA